MTNYRFIFWVKNINCRTGVIGEFKIILKITNFIKQKQQFWKSKSLIINFNISKYEMAK